MLKLNIYCGYIRRKYKILEWFGMSSVTKTIKRISLDSIEVRIAKCLSMLALAYTQNTIKKS